MNQEDRPSGISHKDEAHRSQYEIDADRILYSPEFRRLGGVTQVIPPQDDYVYHNRLTHSLKVAQIAKRLANELIAKYKERNGEKGESLAEKQVDPEVCYVAGLAHDIGHPPFGHAAEQALQSCAGELCRTTGSSPTNSQVRILPDSFEGNAQSIRTVSALSFRKSGKGIRGLDLTYRSLAAIAKYPWMFDENIAWDNNNLTHKKWNFYFTEKPLYKTLTNMRLIRKNSPDFQRRRSVEASIMDWADDITYAVHDLEDFYKAGQVDLSVFGREKNTPEEYRDIATIKYEASLALYKLGIFDPFGEIDHAYEMLRNNKVFPQDSFTGSMESQMELRQFSSDLIRLLSNAATLDRDDEGVLSLRISSFGRAVVEFMKAITQVLIIKNPVLYLLQHGQQTAIHDLFFTYYDWSIGIYGGGRSADSRVLPRRLDSYINEAIKYSGDSQSNMPDALIARSVADFICSLTDRQALMYYRQLHEGATTRLDMNLLRL